MDTQIYDDLLSIDELSKLADLVDSVDFPYYWQQDIDYENRETCDVASYGFAHMFFDEGTRTYSPYINFVDPLVGAITQRIGKPIKDLLRIRAVLLTNVGRPHMNSRHVDLDMYPDSLTAVFYPYTTDGDLYVYDRGEAVQIAPIANRCVVMLGSVPHHGSNPVGHKRRVAVNVNFTV